MALIWINTISVSFGGPLLLNGASLQIEACERIGLLGRNGSGKSTLMKLLAGSLPPDQGEIILDKNVRVSIMPQDIEDLPGTVYDVVASGGQTHLDLLHTYQELTSRLHSGGDEPLLKKIEQVQHQLEASSKG
jgi:ATP-binding cassette subfamily F protein uup